MLTKPTYFVKRSRLVLDAVKDTVHDAHQKVSRELAALLGHLFLHVLPHEKQELLMGNQLGDDRLEQRGTPPKRGRILPQPLLRPLVVPADYGRGLPCPLPLWAAGWPGWRRRSGWRQRPGWKRRSGWRRRLPPVPRHLSRAVVPGPVRRGAAVPRWRVQARQEVRHVDVRHLLRSNGVRFTPVSAPLPSLMLPVDRPRRLRPLHAPEGEEPRDLRDPHTTRAYTAAALVLEQAEHFVVLWLVRVAQSLDHIVEVLESLDVPATPPLQLVKAELLLAVLGLEVAKKVPVQAPQLGLPHPLLQNTLLLLVYSPRQRAAIELDENVHQAPEVITAGQVLALVGVKTSEGGGAAKLIGDRRPLGHVSLAALLQEGLGEAKVDEGDAGGPAVLVVVQEEVRELHVAVDVAAPVHLPQRPKHAVPKGVHQLLVHLVEGLASPGRRGTGRGLNMAAPEVVQVRSALLHHEEPVSPMRPDADELGHDPGVLHGPKQRDVLLQLPSALALLELERVAPPVNAPGFPKRHAFVDRREVAHAQNFVDLEVPT
mmetsp:Transcript_3533/g.12407  ORF Transcript_3533/g.12407 Transcript_3533/m.12407 type:complete len:542 (+) Transcript_3533:736-2361(+)